MNKFSSSLILVVGTSLLSSLQISDAFDGNYNSKLISNSNSKHRSHTAIRQQPAVIPSVVNLFSNHNERLHTRSFNTILQSSTESSSDDDLNRASTRVPIESILTTIEKPISSTTTTTTTTTTDSDMTNKLTVSLVKSIVGSGVLALPAGIASLSGTGIIDGTAIPIACGVIAAIGWMYWYYFQLLGRICQETDSTSYRQAWENTAGGTQTLGTYFVNLCIIIKPALGCLCYSMILADSFQSLGVAIGLGSFLTRNMALLIITVSAILPLCLLQSITALAPFSFLGLLCITFTTSIMGLRYIDGSYSFSGNGLFLDQIATNLQPSFDTATTTSGSDFGIVLACTLATAFVAHYNSPRFYTELSLSQQGDVTNQQQPFLSSSKLEAITNDQDEISPHAIATSTSSSSVSPDMLLNQYQTITSRAFSFSGILFAAVAVCGYATFGDNSQGFILNNYSSYDPLIIASRTTLALSILLTYPLPFVGLRDGITDLFQINKPITSTNINESEKRNNIDDPEQVPIIDNRIVSILILTVITIAASMIRDLQFVLAIGGATFSTAVACVFPTLMFRSMILQQNEQKDTTESIFALSLMGVSIALGAAGITIAINNAFH